MLFNYYQWNQVKRGINYGTGQTDEECIDSKKYKSVGTRSETKVLSGEP